ncbi:hypothetical protein [Rubricoccus marinus]|uniref:Uncharacterized protein n=1 Tax=Rubricoccus marinus TaxID=716817 RepID=A0A259TYT5_9BACT|nr:hypothetical protein [Rubricoccus marinus]OZC02912.1 hypothetical protein BSZ36_07960 [Rubricoccus marinus]
MRVIDHEPQSWFLLEADGEFYLDGRYSNSFVDYSFPMRLDAEEREAYERDGHGAVQRLYECVQYTAPGVAASRSPYVGRKVEPAVSEQMHRAIMAWKSMG